MKKQASKEISDSVRGEEKKRNKKYAKLLGIQTPVDLQKTFFDRLFEKRSEVWSEYDTFEILF